MKVAGRAPGLLALLLTTACGISTTRVVEGGASPVDHVELAREAEALFEARPRTVAAVERAVTLMGAAVRGLPEGHPDRYRYAARTARFASWVANHVDDDRSEAFADTALVFANTAVAEGPDRVEGYYWRAVASGLYARGSRLTRGRAAMTRIREDATDAARIDPTFEHGGPDRLLGTLYLRAPGPPAGVGSKRRAEQHLERALEIAPGYPPTLLVLAELHMDTDREADARRVLDTLLADETPYGHPEDREEWQMEAREMLGELTPR